MAYRGITDGSAYWNELLSGNVTTFQLIYAELGNPASDPIRITNAYKNIIMTGGNDLAGDYNAAGGLLTISPFEETLQVIVNELEIGLDGVTGVAISDLLNFRYLDRTVKVWQGLLDSNELPIVNPILLMDGRISGANITDDPEKGVSKVTVKVSSQWSDFERKGGSRTNDRDQQRFFPGDLGFEYAAASKFHMRWGKG